MAKRPEEAADGWLLRGTWGNLTESARSVDSSVYLALTVMAGTILPHGHYERVDCFRQDVNRSHTPYSLDYDDRTFQYFHSTR